MLSSVATLTYSQFVLNFWIKHELFAKFRNYLNVKAVYQDGGEVQEYWKCEDQVKRVPHLMEKHERITTRRSRSCWSRTPDVLVGSPFV